jgi:glycyl-tRNA synthetase
MKKATDFQSIILALQSFWAEHDCLIWQPYYTQVGAGTYNPATSLRVLGPEPWNVAYVEPSIRPDDGRYGENPNRLQQFYQFQVILKPDPGNSQELYLKSLEALGIDPARHDIRFVEDNWESPALGAWGLGWEVWLDGQEITQFTYFQQAGGFTLNPVSVEITYGLERIAMPLQRINNFRNIRWNDQRTYGDVNLQGEQEHSKYYFEIADVDRARQMYNAFLAEAESALANGLVLPAHDYVLKCSHTFNILDTRGAVGVTERQALFSQMRDMSHRVAVAYLEQREKLGFPWLKEALPAGAPKTFASAAPQTASAQPQAFLLEIGTEELPAGDLQLALSQLQESVPALLDEQRLEHGTVNVYGTPRRIVVSVADLAASQADRTVVVKGPPANRAFDANGQPTPAGIGFARSKGLDVSKLEVREIDGGKYVAAVVHEKGRTAVDVLAEALPGLVAGIKFEKSMRWNESNVSFSRPIRWLLAMLGQAVVPFEYAGYTSGNITRGLRFREPESFSVSNPAAYFEFLKSQGIRLDPQDRQAAIAEQTKKLMLQAGGEPELSPDLLAEVTNLVEAPTALLGRFEEKYLQLPPEVLISVMKKHQRYFPVKDKNGQLLACFVTVRNGDDQHLEVVADGNEQVIRARFSDATFFIQEDMKRKLSDFRPLLSTLTFQFKLGSMLDKNNRIEKLVAELLPLVDASASEAETAQRAAYLCKADLMSQMVVEMTSVQGIMGRYYALHSGESEAVAQAIYEHYLPRFSGDTEPKSKASLVISISDRLDSLCGLFAAGLAPTGTKDPFAQRRTAIGLSQALIAWDLDFDLRQGLALAAKNLPVLSSAESQAACLDFIVGRLKAYLIEQGYRYDVVDAVLSAQHYNPAGVARAVKALSAWVARPDWETLLPAYARCVRITRDQKERFVVEPAAFVENVEKELYQALQTAENQKRQPGSVEDFFQTFLPLIPVINRFFEVVLVMAEEPAVRANRLGLLQRIAALAEGAANLALLEGF